MKFVIDPELLDSICQNCWGAGNVKTDCMSVLTGIRYVHTSHCMRCGGRGVIKTSKEKGKK